MTALYCRQQPQHNCNHLEHHLHQQNQQRLPEDTTTTETTSTTTSDDLVLDLDIFG